MRSSANTAGGVNDLEAKMSLPSRRQATLALAGWLALCFGAASLGASLRETVAAYGGRVELLSGGALDATLGGPLSQGVLGTPVDQAQRAARCALAMHALAPTLPLAVVAPRTLRMPAR